MIGRRSASNAQKRGLGRFQRWLASTSGGRSSLGTSSAEKLLRRTSASQVSRHIVDGGMQVTPYVGRKRLGVEVWGVRRVLSGVLWVLTCCCAQHVRVRPRSTTWTVSSLLPIDAPGLAHRGQERRPVRGDRGTRRACVQWSCGLGPSMLHRGFTPQSSSRIGINRGKLPGVGVRGQLHLHTRTHRTACTQSADWAYRWQPPSTLPAALTLPSLRLFNEGILRAPAPCSSAYNGGETRQLPARQSFGWPWKSGGARSTPAHAFIALMF